MRKDFNDYIRVSGEQKLHPVVRTYYAIKRKGKNLLRRILNKVRDISSEDPCKSGRNPLKYFGSG